MYEALTIIASVLGSGGLVLLAVNSTIKSKAREELSEDLKGLHSRINNVENNYVTCKYCSMQHENLGTILKSMDGKLDILLKK